MQGLISKLRRVMGAGLVWLLASTVTPWLSAQDESSQKVSERKEMLAAVAQARELGKIRVELEPGQAGVDDLRLGWSPKGTKVPLTREGGTYQGQIRIGQHEPVSLEFSRNDEGGSLKLDLDRDGDFSDDETQSITPSERRGKTWYSSQAVIQLPFDRQSTRPYPISIWYVFDPEADAFDSIIRWSRRGWHLGTFDYLGQTAYAVISDRNHDGVFGNDDAFGLGTELKATFAARNTMNSVKEHAWLGEVPFRIVDCDLNGRFLEIEAFDLGRTRAEDAVARDPYAADRRFERPEQPVQFATDLDQALGIARKKNQFVLVDFVTTWCGPCKVMDQLVYTAKPVVERCRDLVCVKLDGDEQKELVEKYEVDGYPTLLLLSPQGEVVRKASGYQSVDRLLKFLATDSER